MTTQDWKERATEKVEILINNHRPIENFEVQEECAKGIVDFIESEIATTERNVLEEYTQFLLKHNYCDADVYAEEPTAVERFMKSRLTNDSSKE